jgi:hypothetical protein
VSFRDGSAVEKSQAITERMEPGWKAPHFENGLLTRGVASISTSMSGGMKVRHCDVHREGKKSEVPLGGSRQILDPRIVRQACEELGLDWTHLPGPVSRV